MASTSVSKTESLGSNPSTSANIREFYQQNKDIIEHWLSHANYKSMTNELDDSIPAKLDSAKFKEFRRFCLLKQHAALLEVVDLSLSNKVIDIGAGFGDFAFHTYRYDLQCLDATDPGKAQYNFIKNYMHEYYTNVYNLPIEEFDLEQYDTAVLNGLWLPNIVECMQNYIFPTNIKTIIMRKTLVSKSGFTIGGNTLLESRPFGYYKQAEHVGVGFNYFNLFMKGNGWKLEASKQLKKSNEPIHGRYWMRYSR